MSRDLFEIASRQKWRFPSPAGALPVEELWSIALISSKVNVPNLNDVAKGLSRGLKASTEDGENFVNPTSTAGASERRRLEDQLSLVKYIIQVRLEEQKAAEDAVQRKATADRIKTLLAERKDKALEAKSDEELLAELAKLGG